MFRFLFCYRLTLMLSLIILTFCLITVPQTQLSGVDNIDKIVHFIFFFGLALIVWWESAGRKQHYLSFWTRFFIIGAATAGLGGVIEVLQDTITTNRSGDWLDFLADCAGVCVAQIIGGYLFHRFIPRKSQWVTNLEVTNFSYLFIFWRTTLAAVLTNNSHS